jgi:hypothetical protein
MKINVYKFIAINHDGLFSVQALTVPTNINQQSPESGESELGAPYDWRQSSSRAARHLAP